MPEPQKNETLIQQHTNLRQLAARVHGGGTREAIAPLLPELLNRLETHFAEEEAEGGVFGMIRSSAPEKSQQVEELTEEHRKLLAEVRGLMDAGPGADIVASAHRLCEVLAEHEATENHLVLDVLETDIGGRG